MNELHQFWHTISATPLMGITLTLMVYVMCYTFYAWRGYAAWTTPLPWAILIIVSILLITHTSYQTYMQGAQFINFLLGPSVVAMGVLLWQQWTKLKQQVFPLLTAAIVGGTIAVLSALALAWIFGLPKDIMISLIPKSITAPVATEVSAKIKGIVSLTAIFTVVTGVAGAMIGGSIFRLAKIESFEAQGFALGTASHGIGTAAALQISPLAGCYAALAMLVQAVLGSLIIPLIFDFT